MPGVCALAGQMGRAAPTGFDSDASSQGGAGYGTLGSCARTGRRQTPDSRSSGWCGARSRAARSAPGAASRLHRHQRVPNLASRSPSTPFPPRHTPDEARDDDVVVTTALSRHPSDDVAEPRSRPRRWGPRRTASLGAPLSLGSRHDAFERLAGRGERVCGTPAANQVEQRRDPASRIVMEGR